MPTRPDVASPQPSTRARSPEESARVSPGARARAAADHGLQLPTLALLQLDAVSQVHRGFSATQQVTDGPTMSIPFTTAQRQHLAFIQACTVLRRRPPAESDFQDFFRVSPPTVHRTIVERGLIERVLGQPRSITLRAQLDALAPLQSITILRRGRRHGVVDLLAALEIATGKVTHAFSASHTGGLPPLYEEVSRTYPDQASITPPHITRRRSAPGSVSPRIHFYHNATSGSGLNQIEGFFGTLANNRSPSPTLPRSGAPRSSHRVPSCLE